MKKFIALLLLIAMAFCFASCKEEAPAEVESVDLQSVYDSYAEYLPEMVTLDETSMMNLYGVDASLCNQAIIATCDDGLRSDEVWLIEVINEETVLDIAELAQNRIDREGEETKNYAPDQYAIVEKAQIITDGNYLAMIISPEVDTLASLFESAVIS